MAGCRTLRFCSICCLRTWYYLWSLWKGGGWRAVTSAEITFGVSRQINRSRMTGPSKSPNRRSSGRNFWHFTPEPSVVGGWGDVLMRLNKTSVSQTLAQSLYLRRPTRFDKVFPVLCSPVRVQTKRKEDKKQILPIPLPKRSVIWFLFAFWMFLGKEHDIWRCRNGCWQSSDILFSFHCFTPHSGSQAFQSMMKPICYG